MREGCPSGMSSASSFHVIRSIPYVGGPRGCRCPMTRRHPMSASALRLAVPLHSLSYRCVSVRIHCTSRLGTAMPSLFHPPLVHSFPLPVAACPFLLNSSPSNTGPFRFISRRGPSVRIVSLSVQRPSTRCLSFPSRSFAGLTRGAVSAYCGSRGQSSLSTSSHSKRPLPLLRHWNRPRSAP